MTHIECNSYVTTLIDHIHNLQDRLDQLETENTRLERENKSWRLWMNRSIERIKEMQN